MPAPGPVAIAFRSRVPAAKLPAADAPPRLLHDPTLLASSAAHSLALPAIAALFHDRYAVERELGGGGMSAVFLAEEVKHRRRVVLKILKPDLAASIGPERFLREIDIVARLTHPHIVPLIDSGEAGGLLYFVAPYLEEGSLRDRLVERKRLSTDEALRITGEIAGAIDYAHRQGFVHRDVKPENILFADGYCMLADFGIARVLSTPAEDATHAGIALGTPDYMSPEQAAGERDLSNRSDIYSLGCVLYEMLAGAPPFRSESPRATMARHVTEQPSPIRALRPEVPIALERALLRALAKDPAARFATAAEFVAACRSDAVMRPAASASRSIAVLPFANGSPEPELEYLSDGITEELINALARVQRLRVAPRSSVFALKDKPRDPRSIGALLGVSHVLEGMVRKSGNRLRVTAQLTHADTVRVIWSERFDRELRDVFDVQDEIARTLVATLLTTSLSDAEAHVPRAARAVNEAAYRFYLRGRYAWNKRSAEGALEAVQWFEQAVAEDPGYAPAYAGLADAYALHVDYRSVPVSEGFARAKDYARKAIALDDSLAEAHASLAWTLFIHDWDWDAAAREFTRAIELDARYATAHQWYAFLLVALGRPAEGLVEAHTAAELDPASVSIRRSLGWAYYYNRRYEEARAHLMRAVEMNPLAEETYRIIGLAWAAQGEQDEAVRVLRESAALPTAGSYAQSILAYALALRGDTAEAEAIRSTLRERLESEYVSPMAFVAIALGLRDWDDAFTWLQRAKDDRRGWMAYLRVHPMLDPVREDPRLHQLMKEMRLI
jgi:eukaryotic-like serine/threonine-protein kinase